jgi:hypothetical protein
VQFCCRSLRFAAHSPTALLGALELLVRTVACNDTELGSALPHATPAPQMLHGSTLDGRSLSAKLDEFGPGRPRERRFERDDEWGRQVRPPPCFHASRPYTFMQRWLCMAAHSVYGCPA